MVGLEINTALSKRSIFIAELTKDSMSNIRELSLRLYENLQMPISDQEIIINELINIGQYRKLAEFVLLKDKRLENNVFEAIGALRDNLLDKLNHMKENDIVRIL